MSSAQREGAAQQKPALKERFRAWWKGVDYDAPHPYLKSTCDKLDADGYVHLPKAPGMGYEIEWDYIDDNLMDPIWEKKFW